ncbi:MAG: OmpA family protein [Gammaproteobacteria bacterium]|jgi:outer membrane protein OmpA-like peptidoglycan-associated protein
MSYKITKTAIAGGIVAAMSLSVCVADNPVVEGYAKSSSGETWKSSSGDCVRTDYKDSEELLESCGYERIMEQDVEVQNAPAGAGVAVVEKTSVVKGGEVLAAEQAVVAEAFIENLGFGFDSAELSAADKARLDELLIKMEPHRPLLRDKVAHLNIIGYTDSSGAAAYNQRLSERRAQAVADYFATQGNVRRDAMKVIGMGEADPIADNATEAGRKQNRRVVIEVVKD